MPGNIISERFNVGNDGDAVTVSNSSISVNPTGTATFESTDYPPFEGSTWLKTSQTSLNYVRWNIDSVNGVLYWQHVMRSTDNPTTSSHVIVAVYAPASSTIRAQIRKTTNGGFTIHNGTATAGTGPAIPAGTVVRLRWLLNWTAGTQQLQVFIGGNLYGSAPDHTINGALTNATRGRFMLGVIAGASSTPGAYHLFDYVDLSSVGFEAPPARPVASKVLVGGAKKVVVSRTVIVNGTKKPVVNVWVISNGIKIPIT